MPVYNAAPFLNQAIDSILSQTFENFDLLIINDGSTDKSVEIIESYSDNRIRIIHNRENMGLIASLNLGMEQIKTKYIARADADDVCLPARLENQVGYMDAHPNVGICGTWFENFDKNGLQLGARYANDNLHIKLKHLYQIHVSHGTAIFRNSVIKDNNLKFNPEFAHAEDYDFFDRMGQVCELANLPKVLYQVRQHEQSVSKTFSTTQQENSERVKARIFQRMGITVNSTELELYRTLQHQSYYELRQNAEQLLSLLNRMFEANLESQLFPVEFFRKHLFATWFSYCNANSNRRFPAHQWLKKAVFVNGSNLSFTQLLKLRIKEVIRQ